MFADEIAEPKFSLLTIERLGDPRIHRSYLDQLCRKLPSENENQSGDQKWQSLHDAIVKAAETTIPKTRKRISPWMSAATINMVGKLERKAVGNNELNSKIQQSITIELETQWNNIARDLEQACSERDWRKLYQICETRHLPDVCYRKRLCQSKVNL